MVKPAPQRSYIDHQLGKGFDSTPHDPVYHLGAKSTLFLHHRGTFDEDGANTTYLVQYADKSGTIGQTASWQEPNIVDTGSFTGLTNLKIAPASNDAFIESHANLNLSSYGYKTDVTLLGAEGNQIFRGGKGEDTFIIQSFDGASSGHDKFMNFDPAEDQIMLSFIGDSPDDPDFSFSWTAVESKKQTEYTFFGQNGDESYVIGSLTVDAVGLPDPGWFEIG